MCKNSSESSYVKSIVEWIGITKNVGCSSLLNQLIPYLSAQSMFCKLCLFLYFLFVKHVLPLYTILTVWGYQYTDHRLWWFFTTCSHVIFFFANIYSSINNILFALFAYQSSERHLNLFSAVGQKASIVTHQANQMSVYKWPRMKTKNRQRLSTMRLRI